MLLGKLILQIYFSMNPGDNRHIIRSSLLFAFILSLYYFLLLYLGNILFVNVLILIIIDFVLMLIYLWILRQHDGLAYWTLFILGLIIFYQVTNFLTGKFVSF